MSNPIIMLDPNVQSDQPASASEAAEGAARRMVGKGSAILRGLKFGRRRNSGL